MQDNQREEIIYLAGLFDGEGTICIQRDDRDRDGRKEKGWNTVYNVTVRIGMIDQKSIQAYQDFFKLGHVDCEKIYHAYRPMYRWSARAKKDVVTILLQLAPHLRLKKEQALLALRFFEEAPAQRGRFMTPETVAKREEFFWQMKKLNGVAISPATTKRMGRSPSVRVNDSLNS